MSFVLLIAGLVMVTAAVRGTHPELLALLKGDFTGPANFIYWIIALLLIGAVGYVQRLKPLSDGLLVIVILVLVLSKGDPTRNQAGGFFQQFTAAIKGTSAPAAGGASLTSAVQTAVGTTSHF